MFAISKLEFAVKPKISHSFLAVIISSAGLSLTSSAWAAGANDGQPIMVLGPTSCSTSGCHGGASEISRQHVIWSQRDPHSRSYATLTSARSARMAEALKIADPTQHVSCTACHAPMQTVSKELRASDAHVVDGVSCASCHGAGDSWLRSHTRKDMTHADRVASGMRDLRGLYQRANACVACHQNIDPQLVNVGKHPALIFELDGQSVSQTKHWREVANYHGAQAWLVGQAVALREMSSALLHKQSDADTEGPRWAGLLWVLQRCDPGSLSQALNAVAPTASAQNFSAALDNADALGRRASEVAWSNEMTKAVLKNLSSAHADFRNDATSNLEQARRAERLVLGLDRLLGSLPADQRRAAANASLNTLFRLAQSPADFSPVDFANQLSSFAQALE